MESKQGKPFCKEAGLFLNERDVKGQCGACISIVYVGCPVFTGKQGFSQKAKDYLRWWHGDKEEIIAQTTIPCKESEKK